MKSEEIVINACYRDERDGEVVRTVECIDGCTWRCIVVRSSGPGHPAVGEPAGRELTANWRRVPDPTPAIAEEPEEPKAAASIMVDDKALSEDERAVFLAAFGEEVVRTGYVGPEEVRGELSVSARYIQNNAVIRASSAVRVFRAAMAAGLLGVLALVGCSEVRVPADATGDGGALRNGCLDLLNTWATYAPAGCEATMCPFTMPVSEAEIGWCNRRLYAARDNCEAMRLALESCR